MLNHQVGLVVLVGGHQQIYAPKENQFQKKWIVKARKTMSYDVKEVLENIAK